MTRSLVVRASVVYLALRLVSGLLLWRASADQAVFPPWTGPHPGYLDMTVLWDGTWYRHVAEIGYPRVLPHGPDGLVTQNEWAFYPMFPMAARLLMHVTGLSFPLVGSTLALVCGWAAAVLMVGLLARRIPLGPSLAVMAVWAAFPSSPSLQLAYTESAAVLVLVGYLWLVVARRWALSGALAVVVGLTRPIAAPLAVVLAVALIVRWRGRHERPVARSEVRGAVVGVLGAGVGAVIWPVIAWLRTGSQGAYSDTMASWRVGHVIKPLSGWVSITEWALRGTAHPKTYAPILLAVLACGIVLAAAGPWARRLGPEMRTWCLAYPAYLAVVLDPFTSIFRYALPLFPVAAVLVGAAHEDRPSRWWKVRAVVLVAAGIVLQAVWIWKLLRFVPPSDYPP